MRRRTDGVGEAMAWPTQAVSGGKLLLAVMAGIGQEQMGCVSYAATTPAWLDGWLREFVE